MAVKRWYQSKYLWLFLTFAGALGGFGAWRILTVKADKPTYLFAPIDRGDIIMQVAANGTLQAVTTVQVGTQVSGTIQDLYVDFNSEVKKGQLLARLNPDLFQAAVDQAAANVRAAEATLNDDKASIASMKANIEKSRVDLIDKQRKFKRTKELFDQGLVTQDDQDSAQAALDAASATLKAAQAQLESAQARLIADESRLGQSKANLDNAKINLDHTIITSPISGTIISRNVDRGQTVAASFSSPTLFTIGEDLTKMQVNTNIDEADVGRIKNGMEATFSVDAYPGETFEGEISQVRLAATTVQNVVTYNAIIDVPNLQLKLKPGMTANVKILIEKVENVLKFPNSAMRFRPSLPDAEMLAAYQRSGEEKYYKFVKAMSGGSGNSASGAGAAGGGAGGMAMGMRQGSGSGGSGQARPTASSAVRSNNRGRRIPLWIIGEDKLIRPVIVKLGLTDGVLTEIVDGKLKEGDKVIVGLEYDPNRPAATTTRAPGFGGPMGGMGGGFRR